jgi:hypothetical protein
MQRLRVFENWMLRRIFGPKRDEVIESWTKLHNEELHNLYSSSSIMIMIKSRSEMGRACSTNGRSVILIEFFWKSQKEGDH